jgi:predicted nucleic acid-binding protein
MIVISNSSPLIAVSCLQRVDIFHHLFGHLHIPRAVYQEVVVQCPDIQEQQYLQDAVDTFMTIMSPRVSRIFSRNLGLGERGVLNLAIEMCPNIVIIDDRRARNEAVELGFSPTLTTDILKHAERQKLIPSYHDAMISLFLKGIYLPES